MSDDIKIDIAQSTIQNCYDITLENEDYTIGKVLEYLFYSKFFENTKILSYCGFKKMHPHDDDSIVRVAYVDKVDKNIIKKHLSECINDAIGVYDKIKRSFVRR
jgi:DNA-directed RNA polymerase subunit L